MVGLRVMWFPWIVPLVELVALGPLVSCCWCMVVGFHWVSLVA